MIDWLSRRARQALHHIIAARAVSAAGMGRPAWQSESAVRPVGWWRAL
ncbi:hypothetical protein ACXDF8_02895 [Mycolicibacterium sp. CBM1]